MTGVTAEGRITPGCAGIYAPGARGRLEAHRRLRPRRDRRQDRHAARPRRPQGLDRASAGSSDDQPLAERQLADRSRPPRSRGRRRTRRRARWTAPTWTASATHFVAGARGWPSAAASTWSSCTAPTATCSRPSSRPLTNHRTDEYGGSLENRLRYPLEVFARHARRLARGRSRCRCASRPATGSATTASRPRTPSPSPACFAEAGVDI